MSKLDHAFVSLSWEEHFPGCDLKALARSCSDHRPLEIDCLDIPRIIRPWRFENMWMEHPNFRPFLATFWNDYPDSGGSLTLFAKKLKALKLSLKSWNIETFKILDYEIEEGLNLIKDLDSAEEDGRFSEQERLRRIDVKCRLDWLWKLKEISWKQKSREKWLRLGDKNTKYFHQIANFNRRRNHLDGLFVDGIQMNGQRRVAAAAVSFYKSLYRERQSSRPFAPHAISKRVSLVNAEQLLNPISSLEIWNTIKGCAGDKAPGPDGFSMTFFKRNWNLLKDDFCEAVADFFSNLSLPVGVNSTFLVFIPKVESVAGFKDLRPISLIGGIYKVISKILMGRMKPLLNEVISPQQCAFIENRQILDAVPIANEAIDSRLRSRKPGLVLKLDIEKAFDHVNWSCLFSALSHMGFGERWINQIKACVTTASFSVLVNGESSGFFRSSRGLRQGDSLSPFLFIVVMEVLSGILHILQEEGRISGFCLNEARGSGVVNHILYADDAIIFSEASGTQLRYVMAALIYFEAISGLKVNLHKSSLFPVGLVPEATIFSEFLGCRLDQFPSSYLGLPLGTQATSKVIWDPVISYLQGRIQTWKSKFLSLGGRIALLKSVLTGLPVYYLSILKAPVEVIKKIEKIQNRFLWAGSAEKDKIHWIRWEIVKTPKSLGGLGVHDMRILNSSLLAKWVWRYATERSAWWRKLIVTKCEIGVSEWMPTWNLGHAGHSFWRWVISFSPLLWKYSFLDPGGGVCAFWFDVWLRGVRFFYLFPRIAAAAISLEATVSDLCFVHNRRSWNIPLTTTLRGGALAEWNQLMARLGQIPEGLITAGPASPIWPLETSGCFSVRSLRRSLTLDKFPGDPSFPMHSIWLAGVPSKVQAFCWMVFHSKIASLDNLQKRGFHLANRCVLCCKDEESVNHLFLRCEFAMSIWNRISSALSIFGPRANCVSNAFLEWKGMNCFPSFQGGSGFVLHAFLWFIWLERKKIVESSTTPRRQRPRYISELCCRWADGL
ncbi:Transposon TX1 uncharacterized 149 kDa protein [Linum perenne]